MSAQGVMDRWQGQAVHHFGEITTLIYQGLFTSLGLAGPGAGLVYATTSYDTIGEHAISRSGRPLDWGLPPALEHGNLNRLLIPGLLDGLPRYIPVLHLHGRVGWFAGRTGRSTHPKSPATNPASGSPWSCSPTRT